LCAAELTMNFGRYEVKKEIGQGGMSTVYHAWDPQLQRDVAIKVLTAGSSNDPRFAARFQREALIIARLEHPAILSVYDFGDDQGVNYIVMRLLSGGTLEDRLRIAPPSLTEVLRILQPIASALDYAHS